MSVVKISKRRVAFLMIVCFLAGFCVGVGSAVSTVIKMYNTGAIQVTK